MTEQESGIGYAKDIRPLFRNKDINSMRWAFDLSVYEDVKANGEGIYQRLVDGSMPCDGQWPAKDVKLFRDWLDEGANP